MPSGKNEENKKNKHSRGRTSAEPLADCKSNFFYFAHVLLLAPITHQCARVAHCHSPSGSGKCAKRSNKSSVLRTFSHFIFPSKTFGQIKNRYLFYIFAFIFCLFIAFFSIFLCRLAESRIRPNPKSPKTRKRQKRQKLVSW